ncbi:MAG: Fur family transcriptional regulator, ferric uptake regulator [Frankiales bacterium]|nr:Fur family transcriptional regulator, ferric uptake regulator [Frankiales bacterium]
MTAPRQTKQRATVLEALRVTPRFVSAQELHGVLRAGGEGTGLTTVYRHLQALAADGTVDVLRADDGESLYRICADSGHHHHLVCRHCGTSVEVEGPAVERWAVRMAEEHGFADVEHTLEIFGTCASCSRTRG